jgi:hypothetical protein
MKTVASADGTAIAVALKTETVVVDRRGAPLPSSILLPLLPVKSSPLLDHLSATDLRRPLRSSFPDS